MIENPLVKEAYNIVKNNHSVKEANIMILNSLTILGAKKIVIQEELDKQSYKSINKYKYPERLASFLKTTNEKSLEWQNMSFAKLAFS